MGKCTQTSNQNQNGQDRVESNRNFNRQFQKVCDTIKKDWTAAREKAAEKFEVAGQRADRIKESAADRLSIVGSKAQQFAQIAGKNVCELKEEAVENMSYVKKSMGMKADGIRGEVLTYCARNKANKQLTEGECCEYCKESNNLEHYLNHTVDECPFILSTCFDCNQEFPLSQLNEHIKICQSKELIHEAQEEEKFEEIKQYQFDKNDDIENFGSEIDESNFEYIDPQDYGISNEDKKKIKENKQQVLINKEFKFDESFTEVPQMAQCKICKIIMEESQIEDHLFAHELAGDNQNQNIEDLRQQNFGGEDVYNEEQNDLNSIQEQQVVQQNVEEEPIGESWNPQDDMRASEQNKDIVRKAKKKRIAKAKH